MSKGINIYKLFTDFSNCINNQSKIIYNRYKDYKWYSFIFCQFLNKI